MNRVLPVPAVIGAGASVAVALPLLTLFTPATWVWPSLVAVLAVVVTGMAARWSVEIRSGVVATQVVVLLLVSWWLHVRDDLFAGVVPVRDTLLASEELVEEAYRTVIGYSAPAPTGPGVSFALTVLVGLTALAVDATATTFRSPALAGVPLLAAFLTAATSSAGGLSAWFLVPPGACWLALVHSESLRALRHWGAAASRASGPFADPTGAFAVVGRAVGATALAAAVVVPTVIPHLPTTFLADGLGTSDNGRGGGGGEVRLSTSIDIARDLGDRSTDPVLVYRTTADDPPPLRVGVLDLYRRGRWQAASDLTFVPIDGRLPGVQAGRGVDRTEEQMTVELNRVGQPQVALPDSASGNPFPDGAWRVTGTGVVELTRRVEEYTADFTVLSPTDAQFDATLEADAPERDDLAVDPRSEDVVRALLDDITGDGDSALTIARKVQSHLRGPSYSYSLDLADETADGRRAEEPLARFLQTRRGYCVQFTTAMVMLSRAAGIPARMAVGFLPGSTDGDRRVVRAADAHAWPELYFPELGWVRFEPTPGVRSGIAPTYTAPAASGSEEASPSPSAAPTTPTAPPTRPAEEEDPTDTNDTSGSSTDTGLLAAARDRLPIVVIALLAGLSLSAVPVAAWLTRRRARRDAHDDAELVEVQWQSLLLRLADVGLVPPDGATPRQASRAISQTAYLDAGENEALGRVVATLERARYAAPGTGALPDVTADARTVRLAAFSRRRRSDRIRATLLPEEGRRRWRHASASVRGQLARVVQTIRDRGPWRRRRQR
ncbi:MAG: transglutaminaseTgpA domain-containing protein [Dermatophilaceae bacterium]